MGGLSIAMIAYIFAICQIVGLLSKQTKEKLCVR